MGTVSLKDTPLMGTVPTSPEKAYPKWELYCENSISLLGTVRGVELQMHILVGSQITIKQFGKYIAVTVFWCEMFFTLYTLGENILNL